MKSLKYVELCKHLKFSIDHGGFNPDGQGGCSYEVCTFIRNYLMKTEDKTHDNTSHTAD